MVAAAVLLSMCTDGQTVSFTEARNYFFRNDAPMPASLKITSQEEFDRYFGMAATMGDGGQPTPIDFSCQFVIAKVLPATNVWLEITDVSLYETGAGELHLRYRVSRGQEMSYTAQPFLILIVDAKYAGHHITDEGSGD